MIRLVLFCIVVSSMKILAVEPDVNSPSIDDIKETTSRIIKYEYQLIKNYESLNAKDISYHNNVDDIINKLIMLKSERAIMLCIVHYDNPIRFGKLLVAQQNGSVDKYLDYLITNSDKTLNILLEYITNPILTQKERDGYIHVAAIVLAQSSNCNSTTIRKRSELLMDKFDIATVRAISDTAIKIPLVGR